MANYQTISEKDVARGIDARSTENQIPEGYSEDLLNVDTNSNGYLSKRPGYQGYYGYLPIRIAQIEHSGNNIIFTLDGNIDTTNLASSPIVVYGKLGAPSGAAAGDFVTSTNQSEYYSSFSVDTRKTINSGSNTLTVPEADHGHDTPWLFTQLVDSTSDSNSSNSYFIEDTTQIDVSATTYDVDFDYTAPSASDPGKAFALIANKAAVAGTTYTRTDTIGTTSTTISITAATHQLNNYNIIVQVYYNNGSNEREKVIPDEVRINATSGLVEIDITNAGASADFYTILTEIGVVNTTNVTSVSATETFTTSESEPFNFVAVYKSSGGTYTQIYPDDISYSTATSELSITISGSVGEDYVFMWEPITITSSTLTVTDNDNNSPTSESYTDTEPQLTLWGIDHSNIYKTSTSKEGHVNHIDSYRSIGEERMIAGLGGNLFSAQTQAEADADYLIASSNVSIENRVGSSDLKLSPLFWNDTNTATRTRGLITDASISNSNNLASVTGVSYVSANTANFTLSFTSKTGTIASAISTNDKMVVAGMGHSMWNGTHQFVSVVSEDSTSAVIQLTVDSDIIAAAYDETGAFGTIGCFTDSVTLSDTSNFAVGDIILSDSISVTPSVVYSSSTTIVIDGITTDVSLVSGLRLFGKRTGTTFPLDSVENFVAGDMCTVTGYNQKIRISSVTVDSSSTYAGSVTLDESVTLQDGATPNSITVVGRWIPVEAPTTSDDLAKSTYIRHLDKNDYISQNTLRSVMVADNMYLTNQDDEVMKFDGTSLYQAGIFRWQPQLFAQLDTTTESITGSAVSGTVGSNPADTNVFSITSGEEVQFSAGDTIFFSADSNTYTVQSTTAGKVYVVGTITGGGTGTIKKTNRYKYYFRLKAIDANNNIIASAATGASDFIVDLSASGRILMRLVGFPAWGNYDYDALEIEVYRTKADQTAPFFLVRTADIDFNHGAGYIDIEDTVNDDFLVDVRDYDPISTALVGSALGTAWEQPLRAKYITTADNRMILANVKDYPELDIVLRKATTGTITAANLTQKKFTFRKDSTTSGTTTDMTATCVYEFLDGVTGPTATTIDPTQDLSRTASTITITPSGGHSFSAGDWVYLFHSTQDTRNDLTFAGWYQIKSINTTVDFTIDFTNSGLPSAVSISSADPGTDVITTGSAHGLTTNDKVYFDGSVPTGLSTGTQYYVTSAPTTTTFTVALVKGDATPTDITVTGTGTVTKGNHVNRYVAASTTTDIPVWLGTDGNYNQVGANDDNEFTAIQRLANAINASMRMCDTENIHTSFVPWMTANAGSEYGVGRLVVRQPKVETTTLEVVLPAAITNANIFVGGLLKAAAAEVSATTRVFPSRVLISYPNYPEIFDAPFGDAGDTANVIDVNSADGQAITGIIPFFGDSVFGGGQAEGVLVVFKENSIYLLDISSGGLTKIQSRGLGCTAPYSIASTRDGIMFANEAGIYRLNRNQSISYVGKFVERIWEDTVNKNQLSVMTGHHYGRGRQYKLSVPSGANLNNSLVLVYDHQREARDQEFGAWSKYDNHAATGWANLGEDAFFGTTGGQVFSIRNLNEASDYRDDASAISMTITYRSMDFGAPGLRKIIAGVNSHFQLRRTDMDGTALLSSEDTDGEFTSAGTFTFTKGNKKAVSALSSLPRRRAQYLQLKYTNSTKDEDVVLAGIDFHVAGLPRFGLPQQNETT